MATPAEVCGWALIGLACYWTIRDSNHPSQRTAPRLWYLVVAGAVLAFRWPTLTARYELNPDESQSLAGALTLWHDLRFWISVDGATAGPLHYFAQMPAALAPGLSVYFAARCLAALFLLTTLILLGRVIARASSSTVERLVILPAALAAGLTRAPDFHQFSTEIVPNLLLALAVWSLGRAPDDTGITKRGAFLMGVLLGAVPFAKLQAAPIACVLGLAIGGILVARRQSDRLSRLLMGALLPTCSVAVYLTATNAWPDAIIPYFLNNVAYVENAPSAMATASATLGEFWWNEGSMASWFAIGAVLLLLAPAWTRERGRPQRQLTWLAVVWLVAALLCVAAPRRPLLHYVQLLFGPWLLLIGATVAALWERVRDDVGRQCALAFGLLGAFILPLALVRYAAPDASEVSRNWFAKLDRASGEIAAVLDPYRQPGDRLAVWGNRSSLYVAARIPQGLPQAHSQVQIDAGRWQSHFLQTYLRDLSERRPAFFVDAVGPGNFMFIDRKVAHEAFGLLDAFVRQNYTLVAERHGTRIYVRNDRVKAVPPRTP